MVGVLTALYGMAVGLVFLLICILCLTVGYFCSLFRVSKYEMVIVTVCVCVFAIALYRTESVTRIYREYDRLQYGEDEGVKDSRELKEINEFVEVEETNAVEELDELISVEGEVTDVKKNTYGYTINMKLQDGLVYVYTDGTVGGLIEDTQSNGDSFNNVRSDKDNDKENDKENDKDNDVYDDSGVDNAVFLKLYGKKICVRGTVVPMKIARNYGNYDEYSSLRSKGVLLKISADSIELNGVSEGKDVAAGKDVTEDRDIEERVTLKYIVARLKIYFKGILRDISTEEEYGILAAMVLGENEEVDKDVKELYSLSGISHIMAISGLHISLIGMGIYKLLRKKMRYVSSAIISMSVMLFFLILIGNPISAARAIIMFLVHMIADLYGRKYDVLSALSLAAILLLFDNPYYILNASFHLSFGAMLAVSVCAPIAMDFFFGEVSEGESKVKVKASRGSANAKETDISNGVDALDEAETNNETCKESKISVLMRGIKNLFRTLAKMLIFNITLSIALMPLNSYLFYRHSSYSPLVNMVVVPLVSLVVSMTLLGMLVAVLIPSAGAFLLGTAVYLLRFFTWLSEKVVSLPYASVVTGKLTLKEVCICYVLLGMCLIVMFNQRARIVRNWLSRKVTCVVVFVVMFGFCSIIFRNKYEGFSINFLDVGQGSAIYIKSETGNDYLIDGGSSDEKNIGEYKLESFLEARQVSSLEYVVITHCDTDHISGIVELMERGNMEIGNIVLPDILPEARDENYIKIVELAESQGIKIAYMQEGDRLGDGELVFTCINPGGMSGEMDRSGNIDINESSLVLVAEYKGLVSVFTGDIGKKTEKSLLDTLEQFDLDRKLVIFDVAHHGSKNSNSQEMIDVLKPRVAVISCGKDNSYGHPAEEVLERLYGAGCDVWCTYESGQVEVYESKKGMMVRGYVRKQTE